MKNSGALINEIARLMGVEPDELDEPEEADEPEEINEQDGYDSRAELRFQREEYYANLI